MNLPEAIQLVAGTKSIVAFTGAGISTESGIPDFRSPSGVWATNRMVDFQEFVSSRASRIEAWRQKSIAWPEIKKAKPNKGHLALAELEGRGGLLAVITQNIDGLHQAAGSDPQNVIELHGTMLWAICLTCADRIPMDEAIARVKAGDLAPQCNRCDGLLKPATVSFGQAMPALEMNRAAELSQYCDLFIAIGSSLVVHPAASLPAMAKQNGARLIIINRTPTPLDDIADLVINEEIGVTLPKLITPAAELT